MGSRDSGSVSLNFDVLLDLGHQRMLEFYTPQDITALEDRAKAFYLTYYGLDFSQSTSVPIAPGVALPGFANLGIVLAPYGSLATSWKITMDTLHDDRDSSLWNIREFGIIIYTLKSGKFPGGINAGMPYEADAAIGYVDMNFLKAGPYNYMDKNCNCREKLACRGIAPSNPVLNAYGLKDRIIKLNCTDEQGNEATGLVLTVLKPVNGDMSNITQINRNIWTWACPNEEDSCLASDSNTELCIASAYKVKDAMDNSFIKGATLKLTSRSGFSKNLTPNQDGVIFIPSDLNDEIHYLQFSAPGFSTVTRSVDIVKGCRKILSPYPNFLLKKDKFQDVAAVLSWENPIVKDLDIHVLDNNYWPSLHIYRGMPHWTKPPTEIHLSHNTQSGFGPETIYIKKTDPNLKYLIAVNNFDKAAPLSTSSAKVDLYLGSAFYTTVTIPSSDQIGLSWWIVALYENNNWKVINRLVPIDTYYSSVKFQTFTPFI